MMKRKSNSRSSSSSTSSEEEKKTAVTVELGLKLQEKNNQNPPFLSDHSGPTFKGQNYNNNYKYNNNNNNNNNNNGSNVVVDVCATDDDVLRSSSFQCFDVPPPYYFPSFSGGMAAAATTTTTGGGGVGGGVVGGGIGGYAFTAAQWKELERQAMIYKYMMASLPVPPQLLYSSNYSPNYSTFTPASYFMEKYGSEFSVRWSGNNKDAEPGRCRRTDGKKWRCSRDVAPNSKYCERHMHRGRPRSRKHVEHQLLRHDNQPQSLSNLPINNNDTSTTNNNNNNISVKAIKGNVTKKTRMNDPSVGPCNVPPSKGLIFDQSVVSNSITFEDSRNLTWSDEQQWHQLMQSNINSSVFPHQLEGHASNLNSTGGLITKTDMGLLERPLFDAWSTGVAETKDNRENSHNNKFPNSSSNLVDNEMYQIHMGLGLIDSWVTSSTTPGGPLAEVLRPGIPSMSDITPPATAVSSPSGVLQKTLATFSDSSGSNSPVCHHHHHNNSNVTSDMLPFNWLN